MDIGTMIERMKSNYYLDECENRAFEAKDMFIADMMLIFNNCRNFNQKGSHTWCTQDFGTFILGVFGLSLDWRRS